jgi:hypothetical protein
MAKMVLSIKIIHHGGLDFQEKQFLGTSPIGEVLSEFIENMQIINKINEVQERIQG